jgi:hypothetical protein
MDAASMRRGAPWEYFAKIDWGATAAWLFGFGIVVYLGFKGGGYDPLVHEQIGIAVWWILLAGTLVGAFPRRRLGTLAWVALSLLACFVAWTALSLVWTESLERTWADLARVIAYLGIFGLALFLRGSKGARLMVGAVAAGIACVAVVALLSRLHPAWFPEADQTARFLSDSRERLAYPLNYWNALAGLIAIGIPLLLQVATGARSILLRALAAAALPALSLTVFLTLSRGGIAAAVLSLGVFLAFASDRLPKALTLFVAAAGSAILIVVASSRDALRQGLLNATAESQGNRLLLIVAVVCLAVGLIQAALGSRLGRKLRPRWTHVSRNQSLVAAAVCVLSLLVAVAAVGAPGRASDAWHEFKRSDVPHGGGRLASVGGEGRYEFWSVAVDENTSKPLTGTGSGTFEYWWDRNGSGGVVRDTHSLYMQTLGELGVVGLLLLVTFLLLILLGGARATLRAPPERRTQLAAALAGCVAFCFTAIFDWMWQVPVLPAATLLLASILISATARDASERTTGLRLPLRAAFVVLALAAIIATAIPLASTALVRQSESDARAGDLAGALEAAKSAQNAQPAAATPRLQQALVLEELRDLAPAAQAARAATDRESTNWRTWLVLARIEAERGRAPAAVRAYRRATALNPHFSLFEG